MNAPVTYIPDFIPSKPGVESFMFLWNGLDWIRHDDAPRIEYWDTLLGKPYTYGRGQGQRTYQPQEHNPLISMIRDKLYVDGFDYYEGCFLNGYRNNRDALGWHADDDPGIDHSRGIAIVTLYESEDAKPRSIQFREVFENSVGPPENLELAHGSLAIMAPGMQFTHQHRIPKAGFEAKRRISLTFRGLL